MTNEEVTEEEARDLARRVLLLGADVPAREVAEKLQKLLDDLDTIRMETEAKAQGKIRSAEDRATRATGAARLAQLNREEAESLACAFAFDVGLGNVR